MNNEPLDTANLNALLAEVQVALAEAKAGGYVIPDVISDVEEDDENEDYEILETKALTEEEFHADEIAEQDALFAEAVKHFEFRQAGGGRPVIDPNRIPMYETTGLDVAQRQLAALDPGSYAFMRAVGAAKIFKAGPEPTLLNKIKRRLRVIVIAVATRAILFWRKCQRLFGRKRPVYGAALQIDEVVEINKYLNARALALVSNQKKSNMVEVGGPEQVAMARYASVRVPMEPDGTIAETYLKRFADFLNCLADSGEWVEGVLAPPSTLKLGFIGEQLRWEKIMFVFPFTKQLDEDSTGDPAKELNARFHCNVFNSGAPNSFIALGPYPNRDFPW